MNMHGGILTVKNDGGRRCKSIIQHKQCNLPILKLIALNYFCIIILHVWKAWMVDLISKLASVLFISGDCFNTFNPVLQSTELAGARLVQVNGFY